MAKIALSCFNDTATIENESENPMNHDTKPKAVVLLSGGLDSTTVLAIAQNEGFECYCLSFSYGQRQDIELERAKVIAEKSGVIQHLVLNLDLDKIGGSALTADIDVPKHDSAEDISKTIPDTYVPARNIIFLSHAVAWAEVIGAADIFIGINALDYSGYPDCRPEFLESFINTVNLGTKAGAETGEKFKIHAPLMKLTKKDIIEKGLSLGVDYSMTHSCYDPDEQGRACGRCDSCLLRLKGFREAGAKDPVSYQ